MNDDVKPRTYTSTVRADRAAATRRAILDAARELFVSQGYQKTTVQQIAERAGVNVDTIYHALGRKPALMRELIETSLSGQETAVGPDEREYVQQIRAAASAGHMIDIYASALVDIHQRMAPISLALRDAALTDEDCRALRDEISARRARNMLDFAADLRSTGELRDDLDDRKVADIVWSMNSAEFWSLLVDGRGWSAGEIGTWLAESWRRMLLKP